MENACIETYTGTMFDLIEPTLDMIRIEDIAHAGSLLCRFTGHTKFHYSIAQHELLGSYFVPQENALEFLLHDAAESYVNDMSRPLKHMTKAGDAYRPIEDRIQSLIRKKFFLPEIQTPIIHFIDNRMLWAEKKQLMGNAVWSKELIEKCNVTEEEEGFPIEIVEQHPRKVEFEFLHRFKQLTGEYNASHQYRI